MFLRPERNRQPLPVPQESYPGPERLREVRRPVHPRAEHGVAGLLLGEGPGTVRGGSRQGAMRLQLGGQVGALIGLKATVGVSGLEP